MNICPDCNNSNRSLNLARRKRKEIWSHTLDNTIIRKCHRSLSSRSKPRFNIIRSINDIDKEYSQYLKKIPFENLKNPDLRSLTTLSNINDNVCKKDFLEKKNDPSLGVQEEGLIVQHVNNTVTPEKSCEEINGVSCTVVDDDERFGGYFDLLENKNREEGSDGGIKFRKMRMGLDNDKGKSISYDSKESVLEYNTISVNENKLLKVSQFHKDKVTQKHNLAYDDRYLYEGKSETRSLDIKSHQNVSEKEVITKIKTKKYTEDSVLKFSGIKHFVDNFYCDSELYLFEDILTKCHADAKLHNQTMKRSTVRFEETSKCGESRATEDFNRQSCLHECFCNRWPHSTFGDFSEHGRHLDAELMRTIKIKIFDDSFDDDNARDSNILRSTLSDKVNKEECKKRVKDEDDKEECKKNKRIAKKQFIKENLMLWIKKSKGLMRDDVLRVCNERCRILSGHNETRDNVLNIENSNVYGKKENKREPVIHSGNDKLYRKKHKLKEMMENTAVFSSDNELERFGNIFDGQGATSSNNSEELSRGYVNILLEDSVEIGGNRKSVTNTQIPAHSLNIPLHVVKNSSKSMDIDKGRDTCLLPINLTTTSDSKTLYRTNEMLLMTHKLSQPDTVLNDPKIDQNKKRKKTRKILLWCLPYNSKTKSRPLKETTSNAACKSSCGSKTPCKSSPTCPNQNPKSKGLVIENNPKLLYSRPRLFHRCTEYENTGDECRSSKDLISKYKRHRKSTLPKCREGDAKSLQAGQSLDLNSDLFQRQSYLRSTDNYYSKTNRRNCVTQPSETYTIDTGATRNYRNKTNVTVSLENDDDSLQIATNPPNKGKFSISTNRQLSVTSTPIKKIQRVQTGYPDHVQNIVPESSILYKKWEHHKSNQKYNDSSDVDSASRSNPSDASIFERRNYVGRNEDPVCLYKYVGHVDSENDIQNVDRECYKLRVPRNQKINMQYDDSVGMDTGPLDSQNIYWTLDRNERGSTINYYTQQENCDPRCLYKYNACVEHENDRTCYTTDDVRHGQLNLRYDNSVDMESNVDPAFERLPDEYNDVVYDYYDEKELGFYKYIDYRDPENDVRNLYDVPLGCYKTYPTTEEQKGLVFGKRENRYKREYTDPYVYKRTHKEMYRRNTNFDEEDPSVNDYGSVPSVDVSRGASAYNEPMQHYPVMEEGFEKHPQLDESTFQDHSIQERMEDPRRFKTFVDNIQLANEMDNVERYSYPSNVPERRATVTDYTIVGGLIWSSRSDECRDEFESGKNVQVSNPRGLPLSKTVRRVNVHRETGAQNTDLLMEYNDNDDVELIHEKIRLRSNKGQECEDADTSHKEFSFEKELLKYRTFKKDEGYDRRVSKEKQHANIDPEDLAISSYEHTMGKNKKRTRQLQIDNDKRVAECKEDKEEEEEEESTITEYESSSEDDVCETLTETMNFINRIHIELDSPSYPKVSSGPSLEKSPGQSPCHSQTPKPSDEAAFDRIDNVLLEYIFIDVIDTLLSSYHVSWKPFVPTHQKNKGYTENVPVYETLKELGNQFGDKYTNFCCSYCQCWIPQQKYDDHVKWCLETQKELIVESQTKKNDAVKKLRNKRASTMPGTICYVCGRYFTTHSILIHETACREKWIKWNEQLPESQRKKIPEKPNFSDPLVNEIFEREKARGNKRMTLQDAVNAMLYESSVKNRIDF